MQDTRDDDHGADRECGAEEEGKGDACARRGQVGVREKDRQPGPDGERDEHADDPDAKSRTALPPRRRDVDMKAGLEKEEEHPEPGDSVQHRQLDGLLGEQRALQLWERPSEESRTQE